MFTMHLPSENSWPYQKHELYKSVILNGVEFYLLNFLTVAKENVKERE